MKKTILYISAIMLVFTSLCSCKNQNKNTVNEPEAEEIQNYRRVDVAEFKEVLKDTTVVLVDVRTPEENAQGCIPGTRFNINVLNENFTNKSLKLLEEGATVAIYCRSGNRSQTAAQMLVDNGFKVIELATGYKGWAAAEND